MRRLAIAPRPGWQDTVAKQGLTFHSPAAMAPQPYWDEAACYAFTAAEVDTLEAAANELQGMCLAAAQHVIDKKRYAEMEIPAEAVEAIEWAWNEEPPAVYGRFDVMWGGANGGGKWGNAAPKLLEYNADTPTSLLEAAVIQWSWMEEVGPKLSAKPDQFNSIHDRLIAKWKDVKDYLTAPVYFAALGGQTEPEDLLTTAYLRDTAEQAGLDTRQIALEEIGWNPDRGCFVDMDENQMFSIFKLYPWEAMVAEEFGQHALATYRHVRWVEPIWKMLTANKGILAVLWELYPGHPLLLETYFDEPRGMKDFVRKPLHSREGANIRMVRDGMVTETDGPYGGGRVVCQALAPEVEFDGRYPVLGLWMIDQECGGMGIRESAGPITDNLSSFVPHYFE